MMTKVLIIFQVLFATIVVTTSAEMEPCNLTANSWRTCVSNVKPMTKSGETILKYSIEISEDRVGPLVCCKALTCQEHSCKYTTIGCSYRSFGDQVLWKNDKAIPKIRCHSIGDILLSWQHS